MKWIAILLPLGLLVALVASTTDSLTAATIGRALCMASLLPAVACIGQPTGRTTNTWLALLALVAAGHVASAALVYDGRVLAVRPLQVVEMDLARQLLLCATAALLAIQLRYRDLRGVVSAGMGVVALVAAAQILYAYVAFGDVWAAFRQPATFKLFAATSLNVAVNPLSATAVVAAALAAHTWSRPSLRVLLLAAAASGVALSGSRSTQVAVGAGAIAYALMAILDRVSRPVRWVLALATCGVAVAMFSPLADAAPRVDELADLTTGRVDLWMAATSRFLAHPWAGWGAQSSNYELGSFLPGYMLEADSGAGGYHSMYLGMLADKGLVAFLPSMLLLLVLARWSFALRRDAGRLHGRDAAFARLAPMVVIMLAVRGVSENAGFMGEAMGVVDVLAYALGAAVVALRSELEERREPRVPGAPSGWALTPMNGADARVHGEARR